jgi:PKD repeat protein
MNYTMKKLFNILPILSLVAMFAVGCKKDAKPVAVVPDDPKPVLNFTYTKPDTTKFLEYQFTSTLQNAKDILWQFGDDSTSVEQNPFHKYVYEGKYYVTLTTRNSQGYTAQQEILLNVVDPNNDLSKVGPNYFLTVGGTFSVSRDNGGGPNANEGSKKVVDGDPNTKFFQSGFAGDLVMTFKLDTPKLAGAYTLTSANDSDDRDPKAWVVDGSEDGIKWIQLDSKNNPLDDPATGKHYNEVFPNRFMRRIFQFNNNVAYQWYRIKIKGNNNSRDFQLAEWSVNQKQPNKK